MLVSQNSVNDDFALEMQEAGIGNLTTTTTTTTATTTCVHHFTPNPRLSRSDVHFPLTSPRKRAPSITSIADVTTQPAQDGQTVGHLTIRGREASPIPEDDRTMDDMTESKKISIEDLPLEVQGKILDYIFGEVHAVHSSSTSIGGTSVSHNMRHPRRKAVSALALVSASWRDMVQERIYRHIKIKGTRPGIEESTLYFYKHPNLTRHVRHIEFWVPVWGDKAAIMEQHASMHRYNNAANAGNVANAFADEMSAHEFLGFHFNFSHTSATLAEIFGHINEFFPSARIFTLEGGHCKRSNMIRHFQNILFKKQELEPLPNIHTFAMRGAWNIMRSYENWRTIENALPNVEEWHCGYAKPRQEAYTTINEILFKLPLRLRHVNISLDGMYSKDDTTLGSNSLLSSMHLCEQLGRIAPHLESLCYTGKICECFWSSAIESAIERKTSRLQALEIVVKSCCRQRVTSYHHETGERIVEELGGIMADGAGITNLVFIRAFERLVLGAVDSLLFNSLLDQIRIRYIDLDSPCALLNPYWHLKSETVYGVWNEEIVERLGEVRPGTIYEELSDGLNNYDDFNSIKKEDFDPMDWRNANVVVGGGGGGGPGITGAPPPPLTTAHPPNGGHSNDGNNGSSSSSSCRGRLYPKRKPKSIKTSSYRLVADTRGT